MYLLPYKLSLNWWMDQIHMKAFLYSEHSLIAGLSKSRTYKSVEGCKWTTNYIFAQREWIYGGTRIVVFIKSIWIVGNVEKVKLCGLRLDWLSYCGNRNIYGRAICLFSHVLQKWNTKKTFESFQEFTQLLAESPFLQSVFLHFIC